MSSLSSKPQPDSAGAVRLRCPGRAAALFAGWQESIVFACLEGRMGAVYADREADPAAAAALLGDFCFFSGIPSESLIRTALAHRAKILVPRDREWEALLGRVCGPRAVRAERYAIRREPDVFDRERLRRAVLSLPAGYAVLPIGEDLFGRCLSLPWGRDLVSQYRDAADYVRNGLGFAVLYEGQIVAGASSYASWSGGIEIEIDTHADFRRRGLAYACGAALILACLDRGLYPSWDAANLPSVALAEKLGYHRGEPYPVFLLG